ncbi:MAG: FAD-binding oxidoreductase [Acidobacteria bacterium]|nr:FAD-binding oxidoreductase [Acidobacteriota bacterium]
MNTKTRRLGGWGFESETFEPSPQLIQWLTENVGPPGPALGDTDLKIPKIRPQTLPSLPGEVCTEDRDRLFHARGQGLIDIIRVRSGTVSALPDAVVRPSDADEVIGILDACKGSGVRIVPWGGGTSVTGGVNILSGDQPIISLDLERMSGLIDFDSISGLAVFGPGTTGPQVESALAEHGFTLGHFPQSWELATVGGWAATRSSGQESLGYGRIEDLVAGMDVVAPAGRWRLPALPGSAAGPDLRHLVMGSEGRLGIITEATLRTRQKPEQTAVHACLVPDLERGLDGIRALMWSGLPLCMLRLSDPPETEVAMTIGLGASRFASLAQRYLRFRGIKDQACLILVGTSGSELEVADALEGARNILRSRRAVSLGRGPGRHWQRDRFRHPYLREALMDRGWATDTLETAVPWSRAALCRTEVRRALETALEDEGERTAVLCHVSHPYIDGTSLYFTFFFRNTSDPEATIKRWARLKRAASDALVRSEATITHHHGVGVWHAPWLRNEAGELGMKILGDAALRMDPERMLNPHVLLDPTDRLME